MRFLAMGAVALSVGCVDTNAPVTRTNSPNLFVSGQLAPADAAPGTCWDKAVTPAITRTVTEDILVQPAQVASDGSVGSPPILRDMTREIVLRPEVEHWVQKVCPATLTPSFVSSVQRALDLRGYFRGRVTGELDGATRGALRRYQAEEKIDVIDPGSLSVEAAKRLGLWTVADL